MIVDRIQPTGLDGVVEKCIDRGLITGIKPTAAKTIAEGVAEQLAHEFAQGRGVQFGQYFHGRPYLSGRVDANGRLTDGNAVNVRLSKGNAFKLTRDDFALTYIDGGNNPSIDFLVSEADTPRGEIQLGTKVNLNGKMLYGAGDAVKVKFADGAGASAAVEVADFTALSSELISFACPGALVAGAKYSVTVERTDPNGVQRVSAPKGVTCIAAPVPAPRVTSAYTEGSEAGTVNCGGGMLVVEGEDILSATEVELLNQSGEVFHTVPVVWTGGRLNGEEAIDVSDNPPSGSIRLTTEGGSATYNVTYVNS
jgi:hypothetical protein